MAEKLKSSSGTQHLRHYQGNFALSGALRYRLEGKPRSFCLRRNVSAVRLVPGVGSVLLLVCAVCASQSLGDAARQNRQQKDTRGTSAKRVFTTDDVTHPACAAQEPKGLSGTWSFTHFDDRFQGWIDLCQSGSTLQGTWHTNSGKSEPDTAVTGSVDGTAVTLRRILGPNQQSYALTLSADGHRLDGFGEGYFLHHTNLNMTRSGDAKSAPAPPSTTSTAPSTKH
jgi:hypothetical protein